MTPQHAFISSISSKRRLIMHIKVSGEHTKLA
jgi:hypothetical protein